MRFSGPAPSPASFPPGLASLISCWCLRFRLCGVVSALSLIQGERVGLSTRGSGALPSRLGQQRRGRNRRKGCREAMWSPSLSASPQATWGQGGLWSLAFVPSKRSRAMTQQVESNHKKQPHSPWLPSGGEPSPPTPVPGGEFLSPHQSVRILEGSCAHPCTTSAAQRQDPLATTVCGEPGGWGTGCVGGDWREDARAG